jgi:hypothetical protein
MENQNPAARYTCSEYRDEMTLLALKQKIADPDLQEDEKNRLKEEIARLEKKIGF